MTGRDLVVGDLHGHRALLERELERAGFDPKRDRVISVGDLIDRGPRSLATLELIEEPWFHAVLGNHELMLLNFLGYYGSRIHARKSYSTGGGEWINAAIAKNGKAVKRLADRVASLPLALHVAGDVAFNATHGDLWPIGSRQQSLFSAETICVHSADLVTSSRHNIGSALKAQLLELRFAQHAVKLSSTALSDDLPITYVGHSPVRHVTVHNSYVHIDQSASVRHCKSGERPALTVLDHREFAYWLGGVATARRLAFAKGLRPGFDAASVRPVAFA